MWVFTIDGHFSAAFTEYCRRDEIVVRARTFMELDLLRGRLAMPPVINTPKEPYPFQVIMKRHVWAGYLAECIDSVYYPSLRKGPFLDLTLKNVFNAVWTSVLNAYKLKPEFKLLPDKPKKKRGKRNEIL